MVLEETGLLGHTIESVGYPATGAVQLGHEEVERRQRLFEEVLAPQGEPRFEQRADRVAIAVGVDPGIGFGRLAPDAGLARRQVVVLRILVLAGAEGSGGGVEQAMFHPGLDPQSRFAEGFGAKGLVGFRIGQEALRVGAQHLLVVRLAPIRGARVAEEAAFDAVVDRARLHVLQRVVHQLQRGPIAFARPAHQRKVQGLGVGELLPRTPAAELGIGAGQKALHHLA